MLSNLWNRWRRGGRKVHLSTARSVCRAADAARPTFEALEGRRLLSAQLIADINPGPDSSIPVHFAELDGRLFFNADDGTHGRELWTSDLLTGDTTLVIDGNAGANWSSPVRLTPLGGSIYYWSFGDSTSGGMFSGHWTLWKSTAHGSEQLSDSVQTDNPYGHSNSQPLDVVGQTLFFTAHGVNELGDAYGPILWRSDGTAAGTAPVTDAQGYFALFASSSGPVELNGKTYFFGQRGSESGLFEMSEPMATPMLVTPFVEEAVGGRTQSVAGQTLFFLRRDGLWKTDGTASGTQQVAHLSGSYPFDLVSTNNGRLFFMTANPEEGTLLWTSDGSAEGTYVVKTVAPYLSTLYHHSGNVKTSGDAVYFTAFDGTNPNTLWRSDGTLDGTLLIKAFDPASDAPGPSFESATLGGLFYFSADDGINGAELWQTDGTPEPVLFTTPSVLT